MLTLQTIVVEHAVGIEPTSKALESRGLNLDENVLRIGSNPTDLWKVGYAILARLGILAD
jgi:hypothetical protein